MMNFTIPETNLICIYAGSSKAKTIENIMDSIPHYTERDHVILAETVIEKLDQITEDEFTEYDFVERFADEYDYAK